MYSNHISKGWGDLIRSETPWAMWRKSSETRWHGWRTTRHVNLMMHLATRLAADDGLAITFVNLDAMGRMMNKSGSIRFLEIPDSLHHAHDDRHVSQHVASAILYRDCRQFWSISHKLLDAVGGKLRVAAHDRRQWLFLHSQKVSELAATCPIGWVLSRMCFTRKWHLNVHFPWGKIVQSTLETWKNTSPIPTFCAFPLVIY